MLKIYNSLTKQKSEFAPVKLPKVNMYTCGVTVYDHCHVGHARSLYTFEIIRRYLTYKGFDVKLVRNITDVDDKIIKKARTISARGEISLKEAFDEVRNTYIDSYYEDLKLLGLAVADIEPKATENISDMQDYIGRLIDKGFAYAKEGNVYFSVRKFLPYGKLSGKKIDDLFSSVRIDSDSLKNDPLDFALWKKAKDDEPSWDSPWGKGRPGWHIECSVMSHKYLGVDTLDIHGGGRDLVFPHHENEIAQSESLTGKTFANYWIHHGLLTVNKEKMAKSLGNFFTIKDVAAKYPIDVLKVVFLQAHYTSSVDFSWEKMEEVKKAYQRIYVLVNKLKKIKGGSSIGSGSLLEFRDSFIEAMDDDFNTSRALAVLFDIVNWANRLIDSGDEEDNNLVEALNLIEEIAAIFALTFEVKEDNAISDDQVNEKIKLRAKFKNDKNYIRADEIRKELENVAIILEDTKNGTTWRRKI
ncbi:MAG: cysteine--tRNA ligase [Candidatus Omnitrophica bacterium]|nr:cysteine--tRNA ligase [Candidatus Omnitrophota bacterium]